MQRRIRYWKKKAQDLQLELEQCRKAARTSLHELLPAYREWGAWKHFTTKRGILMAVRACLSSIASRRLGVSQGVDVHGDTVDHWKKILHASIVSHSRAWCENLVAIADDAKQDQQDEQSSSRSLVQVRVCCMRSDATNSTIWRNSKLFVLESHCWTTSLLQPTSLCHIVSHVDRLRMVADILPMHGGTAEAVHALTCKQIKGLGGFVPGEEAAKNDKHVLSVFLQTSDCGPDQIGVNKIFEQEAAYSSHVWILRCPCLLHQFSLDCKESFKLADRIMKSCFRSKFAYFASLAKTFNVWRAFFGKIFDTWNSIDSASASVRASKTPPVCLISRWGSAAECEDSVRSLFGWVEG